MELRRPQDRHCAVLGAAQVGVLRRGCARAWWWTGTSARAWSAAMPRVFFGIGTLPEDAGSGRALAVLGLAAGIAGLVVGFVQGVGGGNAGGVKMIR